MNQLAVNQLDAKTIENALVNGNIEALTPSQRLDFYQAVCESVGLNALTKPFDYIKLNGKLTLYANKNCSDQLRKNNSVSVTRIDKEKIEDIFIATAYGKDKTGREDSATGAVTIAGLKGDNLANAMMKAETKAKRRLTLSLCGLGMLDETEVATIKDAQVVPHEDVETQIQNKTKWPFKYPENLPEFVEQFSSDELIIAEKQLSKWKAGSAAGTVKAQFPQHGDFFIELLRSLMTKTSAERQLDNELDQALNWDGP